MSEQTAEKAKRRYYGENCIMFGFVSVDSKPMCLECGSIITNDSKKNARLEHLQENQCILHLLKKIGNVLRTKRKDSQWNYPTSYRR